MTHFSISIVSDTVCPWCYIGLRHLQAAIAQHLAMYSGDSFAVSWRPFQLNPNSPRGQSVEKADSYERKFGTEQANLVFERLRSAGKGAGIKFSFGGRTGNTLDSHRLLEFARQKEANVEDLQTRLAEELFADYFERERDITDHVVLTKAAGRVGLLEHEVETFLATDQLAAQVEKDAIAARDDGVHGVPLFNINDQFEVEGAQEPRAFLMLFERFKKKESKI